MSKWVWEGTITTFWWIHRNHQPSNSCFLSPFIISLTNFSNLFPLINQFHLPNFDTTTISINFIFFLKYTQIKGLTGGTHSSIGACVFNLVDTLEMRLQSYIIKYMLGYLNPNNRNKKSLAGMMELACDGVESEAEPLTIAFEKGC